MDKIVYLKDVQWRIFLSYPYKHESMVHMVLPLLKVPHTSSHFWGKHKFGSFYPKTMTQFKGLDACRILKSDILLHVRVTHEDVWKKMLKFFFKN